MAVKRIIYAILFIASVIAFILTDSGVALFFCLCLGNFPILSIVLLLFAKRKFKFEFTVRSSCMRGGALQITMRAKLVPRFLAGYVSATGFMENTTFGKTDKKVFTFKDLSDNPHTFEYVSADSGRIIVHFPKIRITDIFGICSVGVKCYRHAEAIVSPVLYEDINLRIGDSSKYVIAGEVPLPKKGNDHTEIFGVRDYVPGDSLNSVHWKLTGKFDEIKTKEYGSSDDRRTLVYVDMSRLTSDNRAVSDERLNCVLDVAASVSDALAKDGYSHTVGWFDDGKFFHSDVTDGDSFVRTVDKLMSVKVTDGEAEDRMYFVRSPECANYTKIIMVAAAIDIASVGSRVGYDLTVLSVGDESSVLDDGDVKFINIPCDGISVALSSCEL